MTCLQRVLHRQTHSVALAANYKLKKRKINSQLSKLVLYLANWSSLAFHVLSYHCTHDPHCHYTNRIQTRRDTAPVHIYHQLCIQGRTAQVPRYLASLRQTDVDADNEVAGLLERCLLINLGSLLALNYIMSLLYSNVKPQNRSKRIRMAPKLHTRYKDN